MRPLPLEASVERAGLHGWRIRVPLRVEDVHVEKRTMVVEEVEIHREDPAPEEEPEELAPTQPLGGPALG